MINILEGFNGIQKKNARIIFAILLVTLLLFQIKAYY
jgi:hypothetical protein